MTELTKMGLIGTGQMGSALAEGWIRAGLVTTEQLVASDASEVSRQQFAKRTSVTAGTDNLEVVHAAEVIVLAVKPQIFPSVASEIAKHLAGKLVLSIIAGTPLAALRSQLGPDCRIVRIMPNTPCLVGLGACGYSPASSATEEDAALVQKLLEAVAVAYPVEESKLDAITGLSGSGPAFVYMMISALADAGVRDGLPRSMALQLAAQTVYGSAAMVLRTGEHPEVLKDRVCSPAGTTIAGVAVLEQFGFRNAVIQAVDAATQRSQKLSANAVK
ncbi:MAG: pyrroline-5-carboxylate reductase [Thermoguttaceae bacterium]|nr:pyrroline-5-carboxylate reductase [Thermoguttaceae bacterium]